MLLSGLSMLLRREELPWHGVNSANGAPKAEPVRHLMQKHGVFKLDDIEHLARLIANLKSEANRPALPVTRQVGQHAPDNR